MYLRCVTVMLYAKICTIYVSKEIAAFFIKIGKPIAWESLTSLQVMAEWAAGADGAAAIHISMQGGKKLREHTFSRLLGWNRR